MYLFSLNLCSLGREIAAGGLGILFVGAVPAMYRLNLLSPDPSQDIGRLIALTVCAGFFGVFFVIPLRKYYIVHQKLTFPTPAATVNLSPPITGSCVLTLGRSGLHHSLPAPWQERRYHCKEEGSRSSLHLCRRLCFQGYDWICPCYCLCCSSVSHVFQSDVAPLSCTTGTLVGLCTD